MIRTLTVSVSLSLLLLSGTALAGMSEALLESKQEHPPGMKHMMVAPPAAPEAPVAAAPVAPTPAAPVAPTATPEALPAPVAPVTAAPAQVSPFIEKTAQAPVRKPLSVEDALVKPEELKPWSHFHEVVTVSTPGALDKLIRVVEADPGSVPPQALFFLARALVDQKRMEEAALYYYVGQLRLSFDVTRWPPRLDPDDIKRIAGDKNKTEDQRNPAVNTAQPKINNPHEGVILLATTVGAPVTEWLLKDPVKAEAIMTRVAAWDLSAPYAYLPNYTLPQPTPFEEWAKILPNVRQSFFSRMDQFITGLKKLKAK